MNLIIEYFNSLNHIRNGELLYCLHQNLANDYIDKIYIFMEEDAELNFDSPKIERVVVKERPTYQDLFEYCNTHMRNEICIVSNADIIFDDTLRYFNSINMTMQFYLPPEFDENNTPSPSNPEVKVFIMKGGYFAAITYSGRASDKNFIKHKEILETRLKEDDITILSPPIRATYNSPFTLPMLRRNEVMFEIERKI